MKSTQNSDFRYSTQTEGKKTMTFNTTRYFKCLLLAIVLTGSSCGSDAVDEYSNSDSGGDDQSDADDAQNPDDLIDAAAKSGDSGETDSASQDSNVSQLDAGDAQNPDDFIDAATESDDGGETDSANQADGTGGDSSETFGFSLRTPQYHTLTCQSEMGGTETIEELEIDFLCTFVYAGESGYIYLKSKPIGCTMLMGAVVDFEIEGAQLAIGDSVIDLENAVYNRGGNHVNDSFEFDYQGKHLKYSHSSFGYGWRVCQPMDCIQVFNSSADADPTEDGCTAERTLPVICSQIQEDGSFDELIDTFAPCPGDPNIE